MDTWDSDGKFVHHVLVLSKTKQIKRLFVFIILASRERLVIWSTKMPGEWIS